MVRAQRYESILWLDASFIQSKFKSTGCWSKVPSFRLNAMHEVKLGLSVSAALASWRFMLKLGTAMYRWLRRRRAIQPAAAKIWLILVLAGRIPDCNACDEWG